MQLYYNYILYLYTIHLYIQTDIDECATDNGGCQQTCNNTNGSFFCSCLTGYMLNSDQFTCNDIDECDVNSCPRECVNTIGSFRCICGSDESYDHNTNRCTEESEGVSGGVIAVIVIVSVLVVVIIVLLVVAVLVYVKYHKDKGKVKAEASLPDESGGDK